LRNAGAEVRVTHEGTGGSRVVEARSGYQQAIAEAAASGESEIPKKPAGRPDAAEGAAKAADERCPSCSFAPLRGRPTCPRCGWSTERRMRLCTRCGHTLSMATPRMAKSPVVNRAIGLLLSIGAGAAGFYLGYRYGLRAAIAGVSACGVLALALIAATLGFRCENCSNAPDRDLLDKDEGSQLLVRRVLLAGGAAACMVLAVALGAKLLQIPVLTMTSPAGTYSATLPRTHSGIEEETVPVPSPIGRLEAKSKAAINTRAQIGLFAMLNCSIPETPRASKPGFEDEILRSSLRGAVDNVGCTLTGSREISHLGFPGLEGTFRGDFKGKPINGMARVFLFVDEVVMLMFAGRESAAPGNSEGLLFFDSFTFEPAVGG
ncbi:MAG: hypothetical protein ABIJ56_15990, partial [Pseudomonadota bacterium]